MNHAGSIAQDTVHKGLFQMFLAWGRFITWTVLFSALLAVLFALALDGCSRVH